MKQSEALEHLQYIDNIMWGHTAAEVFEEVKKIVQIIPKANFTIKYSKVKGPAWEIEFLGIKWHDGCCQMLVDVINKTAAMSPPTSKKQTQAFLGVVVNVVFGECIYSSCPRILEMIMDCLEDRDFRMSPGEEISRAEGAPLYNKLPEDEMQYT